MHMHKITQDLIQEIPKSNIFVFNFDGKLPFFIASFLRNLVKYTMTIFFERPVLGDMDLPLGTGFTVQRNQ